MSATFRQEDGIIDHTPAGAGASGDIVAVGGIVGVATHAIAAGALGQLRTTGVFRLTLASGKTFAAGAAVYFNAASAATDNAADTAFGYAIAANATTTVDALLIQAPPAESAS
jgi:predicted RecA/RadA family phage recombinase